MMNGSSGPVKIRKVHILAIFNVSDEKKEIPGKLTERYLLKRCKRNLVRKKVTEGTEEVENHGCITVSDEKNMMNVR